MSYEEHKERARLRQSEQSKKGRDIGPIPDVEHPERRAVCKNDLLLWLATYLPLTFPLPFCNDHKKIIARIQEAVTEGGLFALAMPRGSGKSSICEGAALWGTLYGHTEFTMLISADAPKACLSLEGMKTEIECNHLLAEDFPETCYPIARLERIAGRVRGQTCEGKPTYVIWSKNIIVLPTVDGSPASGRVIKAAGLTAAIRGTKYKRPSGETVRPGLVLCDDPQTDASARSEGQCVTRERLLSGAVLGLAGPKTKIAAVAPMTVIMPGDMADNILDRNKHPEWQGERTKMVYAFPANKKRWEEYADLRAEGLRNGDAGRAATEFYRQNQAEMDTGAVVAWEARFDRGEISAIQNAMNLFLRDEDSFFAEMQNEPRLRKDPDAEELDPDTIARRLNKLPRGVLPIGTAHLTAFVDVQQNSLWYAVCAWGADFTGSVVEYGVWPDQSRRYFTTREIRRTLQSVTKQTGYHEALFAGLDALAVPLLGREWRREDGVGVHISKCLIDANYAESTAVVNQWCRQSVHAAQVGPSHGKFIGAASVPMGEWQKRVGEQAGINWVLKAHEGRKGAMVRRLLFDTNWWKSFVASRLAVGMGGKSGLTLFGNNPADHRLFADHLCSEYRVRVEGRGRTLYEWKMKPERRDNHWLDCVVGCAVAASMLGCSLESQGEGVARKRNRVSFREMQARVKGRRIGELAT